MNAINLIPNADCDCVCAVAKAKCGELFFNMRTHQTQ